MGYRINLLSYFDELYDKATKDQIAVVEGDKSISICDLYENS